MRRLVRAPLTRKASVWLWRHTRAVLAVEDRAGVARKRWASRGFLDRRYKGVLREALKRMVGGVVRCVYCEHNTATAIEHFWPKSRFPERTFCWQNLLFACDHCNNQYKRDRFPLDEQGEPLLIDPTVDDPAAHLGLSPREGYLVARHASRKGQTTIDTLELNRSELVTGRKNARFVVEALVETYAGCIESGDLDRAGMIKQCIRDHAFFSVALELLLRLAEHPNSHLSSPVCREALRKHHVALRTWLTSIEEPR